jgi:pilus assembly protein CpaB
MKKNNVVTLLGIALAVAIIATGVFYGLFVNKLSSSTGSGKTLVVAARGLKPGTVVKDTDLKTIPWPATEIPKGAFATVDQVTGSIVFDTIGEDEPVLAPHLSSIPSAQPPPAPPSSGVPSGMRAVSVHVADSTGVLALLRAGHRVDVQVVTRRDAGSAEVRTALQNLEVFSVNPQAELSSQGPSAPVVTLLAKPSEADVLAAADAGARIRLILRNPLDQETRGRSTLSLDTVMHDVVRTAQIQQ